MIKLPAYFTGFGSKADGSASLRFGTQELNASDFANFKEAHNTFGWLIFKENEVDLKDIPTEQAEDKNKTPSKRLRAAIYVWWEQLGKHGSFDLFYVEKMEKIIEMVKEKLD